MGFPRRSLLALTFLLVLPSTLGCTKGELLTPGTPAPELVGADRNGKVVRLSEQRGQPAVVYFYPKDGTPGCTKEACAFRDVFDQYQSRQITIFGVSRDDAESHREFQEEHNLPFPLVADEDGSITDAYRVGTRFGMPARVTFLVGPDGKIARVFPDVDPGVHAAEVLKAAEAITR
jgi:thioredoxin-dependent peroxiredoxin